MLDGYLIDLLKRKWNNYVKVRFYTELVLYAIFFLLFFVCIILKRSYFDYLVKTSLDNKSINYNCTIISHRFTKLSDDCKCAYLYPQDPGRYVKFFMAFLILKKNLFS